MPTEAGACARVLIVDDDAAVGDVLGAQLRQAGFHTTFVTSGAEALSALEAAPFSAVLSDLAMPGMDGKELLSRIGTRWPDVPVVLLTAHGTVSIAVDAMKAGAADFLLKPFDRQELLFVLRKVIAGARAAADRAPEPSPHAGDLVGESPPMLGLRDLIARAARGASTVLIVGESGTGKELIARAIHDQSPRRARPFIKLHCAALPDTLLESELFGYEKGAFTGAVQRKPGRVELAHEGTLFLDEIGDITLATQVKLLRVLQERELERLGGTSTVRVDVRFIAATHRDLTAMVAAGTFREDLFYRLNVVPLQVPPLRDRPGDVDVLARRFAAGHAASTGVPISLDAAVLRLLQAQRWPGNVRQLQNFVERLVVLSDGPVIVAADVERELARVGFPTPATTEPRGEPTLESAVRGASREAVREALDRAKGNRTVAARILGVSRRTLYNKLDEYGLG